MGRPSLGQGEIVEESFAGAVRRVRVKLPPIPGVRQIAPPLVYGQDGLLVETTIPAEAPPPPARPWVGLRGWHLLSQPTLRLLVCDRGTGPARALKTASRLAEALDASVTLLGVSTSHAGIAPMREALRARQREQGIIGGDIIVREGDAAEQIALEQEGTHYDLVVIGVGLLGRPRPGRRRSTTQYVLDRVSAPLLVMRGKPEPIRKILICTAAGEPSTSGIRVGGWIARRLAVPVTLLHVAPVSDPQPSWVRSHLERGSATLRDLEVQTEVSVRAAPTALEGIIAEAKAGGYDLIVVGGTHASPHSFFKAADLTRQLLRHAPTSLMIVPEGAW